MVHKFQDGDNDHEDQGEFVPPEVLEAIEDLEEGRISSKEEIASVLKF